MLNINLNQKIGSKRCTIVSFYRPASQSVDEFQTLLNKSNDTMELVAQEKPFVTVVIGNFNARSSK